jgi:hypothetical protein
VGSGSTSVTNIEQGIRVSGSQVSHTGKWGLKKNPDLIVTESIMSYRFEKIFTNIKALWL